MTVALPVVRKNSTHTNFAEIGACKLRDTRVDFASEAFVWLRIAAYAARASEYS
jgi:hypothetical protein